MKGLEGSNPPLSAKESVRTVPVVASFRGLNENRVIGKIHARTPDHADKSRRGNHKKCVCGGDAPAPPATLRELTCRVRAAASRSSAGT